MDKLRKKGILITWATFSTFSAIYWFIFLKSLRFSQTNKNANEASKVIAVGLATTNFPDLISFIIYIILWQKFRKSNSVNPVAIPKDQQPQIEEQHSGIFPADLAPGEPDSDNSGRHSAKDDAEEKSRKAQNTLKILGYHVLTSMLDLLFASLALLLPNLEVRRIVGFHLSVIITYWIPLWVIKKNFKQMGHMADTCCRLVC